MPVHRSTLPQEGDLSLRSRNIAIPFWIFMAGILHASVVGMTDAIEGSSASTAACVVQQQPQEGEISHAECEGTEAINGDDGQDIEIAKASDENTDTLKGM